MNTHKSARAKGSTLIAVGFDYALAVNRLLDLELPGGKKITRAKLNTCLGFGAKGTTSLSKILAGTTPNHYAGEMLYAVCIHYFGQAYVRAELMSNDQRDGDLRNEIIEKHLGVHPRTK